MVLAGIAVWSHVTLSRLRRNEPRRPPSPDGIGIAVAALVLVLTCSVNLYADVQRVQAAVLGARPLGLPLVLVACVIDAILVLPAFWMFPHLMRLVMRYRAAGGGGSKADVVRAVVRAAPGRSRAIVIASAVYFVAIFAAWIAYASYRRI